MLFVIKSSYKIYEEIEHKLKKKKGKKKKEKQAKWWWLMPLVPAL